MNRIVVADAGPMIALARIECLALLVALARQGYRLSNTLLEEVLRLAGETGREGE